MSPWPYVKDISASFCIRDYLTVSLVKLAHQVCVDKSLFWEKREALYGKDGDQTSPKIPPTYSQGGSIVSSSIIDTQAQQPNVNNSKMKSHRGSVSRSPCFMACVALASEASPYPQGNCAFGPVVEAPAGTFFSGTTSRYRDDVVAYLGVPYPNLRLERLAVRGSPEAGHVGWRLRCVGIWPVSVLFPCVGVDTASDARMNRSDIIPKALFGLSRAETPNRKSDGLFQ